MAINISTITINASVQKVWDIITKPELVKQWQFGSDLITYWKLVITLSLAICSPT